jgi:hypothetical protein
VSPVKLTEGRGEGRGWATSQIIQAKESLPSINHSILSALEPSIKLNSFKKSIVRLVDLRNNRMLDPEIKFSDYRISDSEESGMGCRH